LVWHMSCDDLVSKFCVHFTRISTGFLAFIFHSNVVPAPDQTWNVAMSAEKPESGTLEC